MATTSRLSSFEWAINLTSVINDLQEPAMRSKHFVPSLLRGIAALALSMLTIALFVVAPAQMQVRDEPRLLTALNASVTTIDVATPLRIAREDENARAPRVQ
jgi:hypothetical protein